MAAWALAGCVTVPRPAAIDTIRAQPMYFKVSEGGDVETYDAEALFEQGNKAFDEADWKRAYDGYARLIAEFPESPWIPSALYNGGLCLDRVQDYPRAITFFTSIVESYPQSPLRRNAIWNLVDISEKISRWTDARKWLGVLESETKTDQAAEIEIRTRKAIADALLDPHDDQIGRLQRVSEDYRSALLKFPFLQREHLARTYFTIGELYLAQVQRIKLELPQADLERNLQTKAEKLLRAQDSYMQAIKAQDPKWATASVYRIGFLYEGFYAELRAAPEPTNLDAEELQMYREELAKAINPVKQKAQFAYRRIIEFARRMGLQTDWVEKAERHLAALRKFDEAAAAQPGAVPPMPEDGTAPVQAR